ncbi:MAG: hypothetical protein Fur006_28350 [Coleofasciculaceae cyanobacterium]
MSNLFIGAIANIVNEGTGKDWERTHKLVLSKQKSRIPLSVRCLTTGKLMTYLEPASTRDESEDRTCSKTLRFPIPIHQSPIPSQLTFTIGFQSNKSLTAT